MKITLEGKPLSATKVPPGAARVLLVVEKLKDGGLFSMAAVCGKARVAQTSFSGRYSQLSIFNDFRINVGSKSYWGNKRTIQEARKQLHAKM